MRPSEYCALKWADLDFWSGQLSVCRSLDFLPGGGWECSDNKTARSRRTIKLWASVAQTLRSHRTQQGLERDAAGESWQDHDFVFTNELGGPVNRNNLAKRNFRRVLKAADLPQIRLYDLRHTAATTALAAGVPVKVVSEMLGHASVAITLDIYSHVLPHMQDEAAQKMESLVLGGEPAVERKSGKRHTIGTQRPN
jgi:integrase